MIENVFTKSFYRADKILFAELIKKGILE